MEKWKAKRGGDKAMVEKQPSVRETKREAGSEGDKVLVGRSKAEDVKYRRNVKLQQAQEGANKMDLK